MLQTFKLYIRNKKVKLDKNGGMKFKKLLLINFQKLWTTIPMWWTFITSCY